MKNLFLSIVLFTCALAPTVQLLAQEPQSEFVPVTEIPASEQLPSAPLVIAAYAFVWAAFLFYTWTMWKKLGKVEQELSTSVGTDFETANGAGREDPPMNFANMTSAHFIFIPVVLFVGVVIGWILGSRAAQDAFAMEMKKRESRLRASGSGPGVPNP